MKNVLVTGCAGFIGSKLTESLLNKGWNVTGIDCFMGNYSEWIKKRNIESFLQHPRFTWIQSDLRLIDLNDLLKKQDYVFHQAALPGVRSSWGNDFQSYVDHNILATQKLLEAVKQSDVKKMVYASSSSIYGLTSGPTSEEHLPSPYSPYGVTKLSGEHLCRLYYQNYDVPVVALRYFTVYGPRQRPDMAFHKFMMNIMARKPISVYGDGKQTRDFTYIDDAVEANVLALERGQEGGVYNIGGSSRMQLITVIQMMGDLLHTEPKLTFIDEQPGDPRHTWADISKAQQELGYKPRYDIEKGLFHQAGDVRSLYNM